MVTVLKSTFPKSHPKVTCRSYKNVQTIYYEMILMFSGGVEVEHWLKNGKSHRM